MRRDHMGEIADYAIERALASEHDLAYFEASHLILPRRAHMTVATAKSAAPRILREACMLETLRHPGVPRIYDCGIVADGLPWVARELVVGKRYPTQLKTRELAELLHAVAMILAHAHARGVIHGDVWLDAIVKDDCVRLLHWHHARRGAPEEGAGDVYALGLAAHAVVAAPPPRIVHLVTEMLAPDPRARPTAAQVAAEAGRILEEPDYDNVEEVALTVDLSRQPPSPPPRPIRLGSQGERNAGVPIASLKLR
jgi:hypothetical protein